MKKGDEIIKMNEDTTKLLQMMQWDFIEGILFLNVGA